MPQHSSNSLYRAYQKLSERNEQCFLFISEQDERTTADILSGDVRRCIEELVLNTDTAIQDNWAYIQHAAGVAADANNHRFGVQTRCWPCFVQGGSCGDALTQVLATGVHDGQWMHPFFWAYVFVLRAPLFEAAKAPQIERAWQEWHSGYSSTLFMGVRRALPQDVYQSVAQDVQEFIDEEGIVVQHWLARELVVYGIVHTLVSVGRGGAAALSGLPDGAMREGINKRNRPAIQFERPHRHPPHMLAMDFGCIADVACRIDARRRVALRSVAMRGVFCSTPSAFDRARHYFAELMAEDAHCAALGRVVNIKSRRAVTPLCYAVLLRSRNSYVQAAVNFNQLRRVILSEFRTLITDDPVAFSNNSKLQFLLPPKQGSVNWLFRDVAGVTHGKTANMIMCRYAEFRDELRNHVGRYTLHTLRQCHCTPMQG